MEYHDLVSVSTNSIQFNVFQDVKANCLQKACIDWSKNSNTKRSTHIYTHKHTYKLYKHAQPHTKIFLHHPPFYIYTVCSPSLSSFCEYTTHYMCLYISVNSSMILWAKFPTCDRVCLSGLSSRKIVFSVLLIVEKFGDLLLILVYNWCLISTIF